MSSNGKLKVSAVVVRTPKKKRTKMFGSKGLRGSKPGLKKNKAFNDRIRKTMGPLQN